MIFIIDHIHHLMNESKMQSFAYNSDRRMYVLYQKFDFHDKRKHIKIKS
jgi:hypothetical protein